MKTICLNHQEPQMNGEKVNRPGTIVNRQDARNAKNKNVLANTNCRNNHQEPRMTRILTALHPRNPRSNNHPIGIAARISPAYGLPRVERSHLAAGPVPREAADRTRRRGNNLEPPRRQGLFFTSFNHGLRGLRGCKAVNIRVIRGSW